MTKWALNLRTENLFFLSTRVVLNTLLFLLLFKMDNDYESVILIIRECFGKI
jgi:hypothetical protein